MQTTLFQQIKAQETGQSLKQEIANETEKEKQKELENRWDYYEGEIGKIISEGENEYTREINQSCVIFKRNKVIRTRHWNEYTIENEKELEKEIEKLEQTNCTGYHYAITKEALKQLKKLKEES